MQVHIQNIQVKFVYTLDHHIILQQQQTVTVITRGEGEERGGKDQRRTSKKRASVYPVRRSSTFHWKANHVFYGFVFLLT